MAINRLMRSALKALSYPDINTPKHYKAERVVVNVTHKHVLRPFYKIWDHKVSAEDHDIPVRIFSPETKGDFPVLLFFHGGGWVTGNIDSYDKVCTVMAHRTRHKVVSVDYRLAPEFPFPAGLEDCYRVAEELFTQPGLLGVTADQITLIGDSAGGNLAAALSIMARDRGVSGHGRRPRPRFPLSLPAGKRRRLSAHSQAHSGLRGALQGRAESVGQPILRAAGGIGFIEPARDPDPDGGIRSSSGRGRGLWT